MTSYSQEVEVPIPHDNFTAVGVPPGTGGELDWVSSGIRVPKGSVARIEVSGFITLNTNPGILYFCQYFDCTDPSHLSWAGFPDGTRIGPFGLQRPSDGIPRDLTVLARIKLDDGTYLNVPMVVETPVQGFPSSRDSVVFGTVSAAPMDGTVELRRMGIPGTGTDWFNGQLVYEAALYLLTSHQHVRARISRSESKLVLECNGSTGSLSVVRADQVNCHARGDSPDAQVTVKEWAFDGRPRSDGDLTSVAWAGPVVRSGTVRVRASLDGGVDQTAGVELSVAARNWHWNENNWSYHQGAAIELAGHDPRVVEPTIGVAVLFGWNCHEPTCSQRWVQPDVLETPDDGYTLDQAATGPNASWWYVKSAEFSISRASNLNPFLLPGAPTRVIHGTQANDCHHHGVPGVGPVAVNFYVFNKVCKGVDVDDLVARAWAHEGYGTNGHNGHQSVGQDFASLPRNDPQYQIESAVAATRDDIHAAVIRRLRELEKRIDERAGDHQYVRGNYSGRVWMWNSTTSRYDLPTTNIEF